MAVKKKAKKKGKSKPSVKKKKAAVKKRAAKKPTRAKTAKKKSAKKKPVTKKSVARKPAAAAKPAAPKTKPAPAAATVPAGEVRVGTVTHYYSHLMVAVVKVDTGVLREGDDIHIKGHTTDFRQRAGSLELDHVHVPMAKVGESVGLKVIDHAREHDAVYLVSAP